MEINSSPILTPYPNDYLANTNSNSLTAEWVGVDVNPSNTVEYIPVVYGFRQVTGIRLFTYVNAAQNILYAAYALSEGYCRGINQIYIDDNAIPVDVSSLTHRSIVRVGTGAYAGILELEFIDGRGTAHRNSISGAGSSLLLALEGQTVNYANLCYLVCKFTWSGETSPYKDVPKVTVDLFGRIMPEFTGATANNYSTNPVDLVWDILQHPIYGRNIAKSEIDSASFTDVKNFCSTQVTNRDINYDKFTTNWIMDTGKSTFENLQSLLETYMMTLNYVQGKWTLSIEADPTGNLGSNLDDGITLTESNIIGNIHIQYPSIKEKYNKVIVEYPDKDANFVMRTQQFPEVGDTTFLTEDNNFVFEFRTTTNLITDAYRANDYAQMLLRKSRGQLIYRFKATKTALRCRVGDFIYLNTTYPYINAQQVVIISMTVNNDLTVDMECALYNTGFYPGNFTNQVKNPNRSKQNITGTIGVITDAVTSPILNPEPPASTSFEVFANKTEIYEGDSVVFTIRTVGIANGTTIYYDLGPLTPGIAFTSADIGGESTTGSLTIQSNSAVKTFTFALDGVVENYEDLYFKILNSTKTATLAQCSIRVRDTTSVPATPKYRYTLDGMSTFGTDDWYIGFTGTGTTPVYDSTETLSGTSVQRNCRMQISNYAVNATANHSVYEINFSLVDRLLNAPVERIIYILHDVQISGSPQYTYTKRGTNAAVVRQFNYTAPPSGVNQLQSLRLSPTPVIFDEKINSIDSTTNIPGAPRMRRQNQQTGVYTNLGQDSIKVAVAYGVNQWNTVSVGNTYFEHTVNGALTSSNTFTILFRFVEMNPTTYAFTEIGTLSVPIGLSTAYLTNKYLAASRTNLKATSKQSTVPF